MAQHNSVSYPLRRVHITSPFGMRLHPIDKVYKLHNGLDLSAKNEEVYAMLDGVVESTGYNMTSGNYIILKHAAGLSVSYCHLRKNIKAKGDIVRAGDIVAVSGNTGKSTNYHLHFVVRKDCNYIDPILLIKYVDEVRKDIIRNYAQYDHRYTFQFRPKDALTGNVAIITVNDAVHIYLYFFKFVIIVILSSFSTVQIANFSNNLNNYVNEKCKSCAN